MGSPKITVVIPNYNHASFLRQRIDSVINQTYTNIEIIILDDCSTDNSRDVIEQYRSNHLVTHIIYNNANSGSPFIQWKKGAELGTGDWIWFAESDDYAEHDFLELMSREIDESIGLVYCDSKIVTEEGVAPYTYADIKNIKFNTSRWSANYKSHGVDEIEFYLLKGGTINNSSAVIFDRKLLLDSNPFDLPLRLIGEKYAFLKVLNKKNVAYCKSSLNYYRNPFTVTSNHLSYVKEQFLVFSWVYKNVIFKDRQNFYEAFHDLTALSLIRNWTVYKFKVIISLFKTNPLLFCDWITYNAIRPFKNRKTEK